jgi:NTE family protein
MRHPTEPRLAVVLGSGGVRSVAALGVAEVLWREGIRPDLFVGCSAGAIFGATLAMGHDTGYSLALAAQLWTAEITRQHRWNAIPKMVWPRLGRFDADFSLRDDRLIMARLNDAFGEVRLEDLPTPLRVTATDAASGRTVVLRRGRVVDAIRASIAMPFMFAPRTIEGRRLIDGFVSDPLPVSAAVDAHTVLAIGFDAPMPQRVNGPSRLLAQVTSAMTNNLMHARLAAAELDGMRLLRVFPQLNRRIGLFETGAMPYLVQEGRLAAEQQLPALIALLEKQPHLQVA